MILGYISFLIARRQEDRPWADSFLENRALSQPELQTRLQARSVALVGNAQATIPHSYGKEIDDHDFAEWNTS